MMKNSNKSENQKLSKEKKINTIYFCDVILTAGFIDTNHLEGRGSSPDRTYHRRASDTPSSVIGSKHVTPSE